MNHGMDLMGNPLGRSTRFLITCAANPAADDIEREIKRLEKKLRKELPCTLLSQFLI